MRAEMLRAGLMIGLWLLWAVAPAAESVVLAPQQMQNAARLALRVGDPVQALRLSEALLSRDGDDFVAHLIRARALRDLDRLDEARTAARSAWAAADGDHEHYAAAMVRAQVVSSAGNKTAAQLWLRRAMDLAPREDLKRHAIRDFKYLRATNPWSTHLSFSVTPESNINNGSSSRTSYLNYELTELLFGEPLEYQLSGAALALSGVEYAFGFDTRYRFLQTAGHANDLFLSFNSRHYSLSSSSKAAAPTAHGSDFAFQSFFAGYGHRMFNFSQRGELALRADLGQSWYGGSEYARHLRGSVTQSYQLSPTNQMNGRITAERQIGIRTVDLDSARIDIWNTRRLDNGNHIKLAAHGKSAWSPVASETFTELGVHASLTLAKPFLDAQIQFGLGYSRRDHDVSPHSPDGRHEDRVDADISLTFQNVDYFGFNPTVSLHGSAVDSNIGLYDVNRVGINFGIRSAF